MKATLYEINNNFEKIAPRLFMLDPNASNTAHVGNVLREKYLNNEPITEGNVRKLGELFSDSIISHGVHRLVSLMRKHTNVYYFMFDIENPFTFMLLSSNDPKLMSKDEKDSHLDIYVLYKLSLNRWFHAL